MMSVRFNPPMSLHGDAALKMLEKVWAQPDDFQGSVHGLGFLFLYNLLQVRVTDCGP